MKFNTTLSAKFYKVRSDEEEEEIFQFNTKNLTIFLTTDLTEAFDVEIRESLDRQINALQERGSGWSLKRILHLTVNMI